MADYLTNQDLIDRIGSDLKTAQLTGESGSVPDQAVLTGVREHAESLLDSHLPPKYAPKVDLTAYPHVAKLIKGTALDLAEYLLRSRRPPVPEDYRTKYEDALAWLAKLQKGEVALPSQTPIPEATSTGPIAEVYGPKRQFTNETLEGL